MLLWIVYNLEIQLSMWRHLCLISVVASVPWLLRNLTHCSKFSGNQSNRAYGGVVNLNKKQLQLKSTEYAPNTDSSVQYIKNSSLVFIIWGHSLLMLVLWGSISYAFKAPDIPPNKTEDLERTTLGPPQAGESEAENNMCMCVQ